jgi:hypothetical protein
MTHPDDLEADLTLVAEVIGGNRDNTGSSDICVPTEMWWVTFRYPLFETPTAACVSSSPNRRCHSR